MGSSANGLVINGTVHGGQQPVSGATIQLYQYGVAGTASVATPLLTQPVTTTNSGSFTITGLYPCNTDPNNFGYRYYLVATGGNPGLGSGANSAIALMAALPSCQYLTPTGVIQLDERSTVTAVSLVAPYMTNITHLGDNGVLNYLNNSYDAVGLEFGYAQGMLQTDFDSNQTVPTTGIVPFGFTAPTATINSFANMIASCVNSAGGVAGDGSPCGNLFLYAGLSGNAPMNTIQAVLNIALNPTNNAANLFALGTATGPFQPTLTTAPTSWAVNWQALPTSNGYAIVAATASGNGVVTIPFTQGSSTGAFSLAVSSTLTTTANPVTISINTGGAALPLAFTICQTTISGQCMAPPATTTSLTLSAGVTPTFSVFVTANATLPSSPIYVQMADANGTLLGGASVSVIAN